VHFIVLDNTSDPAPIIGATQLAWLKADLARLAAGRAYRGAYASAAVLAAAGVGLEHA
jgi:hypothetical protein